MRDGFKKVKEITAEAAARDGSVVVVVSAFKEVTDRLLKLGVLAGGGEGKEGQVQAEFESLKKMHLNIVRENISDGESQIAAATQVESLFLELRKKLDGCLSLGELSLKTKDHIAGFGERLSALILSAALQSEGQESDFVDARELVKTNTNYSDAEVDTQQTYKLIAQRLGGTRKKISVVTGFIGSAPDGSTTTLGRGGSDYTAALFAAALKSGGTDVEEIQVWKETNGVESADPNMVHGTKTIPHLTYDEMGELAGAGAKVLYRPAVHPAEEQHIPVRVLNTFNRKHSGTLIDDQKNGDTEAVKAVSSVKDIAIITVKGSYVHKGPGVAERVFASTARAQANVTMISQDVSQNSICFAVSKDHEAAAMVELKKAFAKEMNTEDGKKPTVEIRSEPDHVIIAVVGESMAGQPGVSARFFNTLSDSGVNVRMIAQGANELNISVAIPKADLQKSLQVVHDEFIHADRKIVYLYIIGPGRVGKETIKRLIAERENHLNENEVEFRIAGVINSSRMLMMVNGGIPFESWEEDLQQGEQADLQEFVRRIFKNNLPHSIVIDTSASEAPVEFYEALLKKRVRIVTANKKAASGPLKRWQKIKKAAKRGNAMKYGTNVAAGLGVIDVIQNAREGGNRIKKIEGAFSGTLGFIFSNFDGKRPFSQVVREAYEKEYTEPNPADDLNLSDVARKIVILAREAGAELELSDVNITPLLSEECLKAENVEIFFKELKKHDEKFAKLHSEAASRGEKLRVVAEYDESGKATIELISVGPKHATFGLEGTDNLVKVITPDRPAGSIYQGAGAGTGPTASGVVSDLIKAAA